MLSALAARRLSEKGVNEENTVVRLGGWVGLSVILPPLFSGFGLVGKAR